MLFFFIAKPIHSQVLNLYFNAFLPINCNIRVHFHKMNAGLQYNKRSMSGAPIVLQNYCC